MRLTATGAEVVGEAQHLSRRTMLGMLGLGTLAACTNGNPETTARTTSTATKAPATAVPTTATPTPPVGQLYYGAATAPDKLDAFEAELGNRLACYRTFFKNWEVPALVARAQSDVEMGRVPMVSIKPPDTWVATAQDTAWLDSLMEPLSEIAGPVYLIINHEPENDAHRFGGPADYVALQRAALDRATQAGGQLTVVPVLSSWSFDERAGRTPREWNFHDAPIYGLDLYNPWALHNGKPWIPFEDKLLLAEEEAAGRPILVGEYGCRSDPRQPGRAAQWMKDAFATALTEGVVAMAYFNSAQNSPDGTWELDAETLPVFKEILNSSPVARI